MTWLLFGNEIYIMYINVTSGLCAHSGLLTIIEENVDNPADWWVIYEQRSGDSIDVAIEPVCTVGYGRICIVIMHARKLIDPGIDIVYTIL